MRQWIKATRPLFALIAMLISDRLAESLSNGFPRFLDVAGGSPEKMDLKR
jgi:hypothetical protein